MTDDQTIDPRDATIAALKAEVERLTKERDEGEMRIATLLAVRDPQPAVATLAANLDRIAKERDNLSLTLRGALARADGVEADLARHQRALAAGPAALRKMTIQYCDDKAEEAAQIVIEAQRRAMEEGKSE